MKIFLLFLLYGFNSQVLSKSIIAKEFPFTIEALSQLENKIEELSSRQYKGFPFIKIIGPKNKISLFCGANLPNKDLKGCKLLFNFQEKPYSLSVNKDFIPNSLFQKVSRLTSEIDPNQAENHLHFNQFFSSEKKNDSFYYCRPSGKPGNKKWSCFLYVKEEFN